MCFYFCAVLFLSQMVQARVEEGKILTIADSRAVWLEAPPEWKSGDRLLVQYPGGTNIAYLRARERSGKRLNAELVIWLEPTQLMPGQKVIFFRQSGKGDVDGRAELLRDHAAKGEKVSARYKKLFYLNSQNMGQSAATLDRNEHAINLFGDYNYGITDRLNVGSLMLANALKFYNLRLKYNFLDNDVAALSASVQQIFVPGFT